MVINVSLYVAPPYVGETIFISVVLLRRRNRAFSRQSPIVLRRTRVDNLLILPAAIRFDSRDSMPGFSTRASPPSISKGHHYRG